MPGLGSRIWRLGVWGLGLRHIATETENQMVFQEIRIPFWRPNISRITTFGLGIGVRPLWNIPNP